jgi:hypothetical protein
VPHRIPLGHIAEGYHIFSAKLDGCLKPIIVPNEARPQQCSYSAARSTRLIVSSALCAFEQPGLHCVGTGAWRCGMVVA